MTKKILILFTALILLMTNAYAHKDRIERPIKYRFVFANQDTLFLVDTNQILLNSINTEIINGKRKLDEIQLTFKTGELINIKYIDSKLTSIKINDSKKIAIVPKETVDKIETIHFLTIALLWDGQFEKAFGANYFIIQFDSGIKADYGKYPYIQINFSDNKFTNAIIWRQISENSKQWKEL